MSKVTKQDEALMAEIKDDPVALELLKAKAGWEHMSLYKVLHEYGDPRTWSDSPVKSN